MKRLLILAAASAALLTSACGTTAGFQSPTINTDVAANATWQQTADAQPFEASRAECRAATTGSSHKDAFPKCMAAKGWTRS